MYVFNTATKNIVSEIPVGDNPNELCLTANGNYLYVANSNDNSVSIIKVAERKVIETLNAALYPDAPNGSTTNGLALSDNEKVIYVANADNNCLAVFDVSHLGESKSLGWWDTIQPE